MEIFAKGLLEDFFNVSLGGTLFADELLSERSKIDEKKIWILLNTSLEFRMRIISGDRSF